VLCIKELTDINDQYCSTMAVNANVQKQVDDLNDAFIELGIQADTAIKAAQQLVVNQNIANTKKLAYKVANENYSLERNLGLDSFDSREVLRKLKDLYPAEFPKELSSASSVTPKSPAKRKRSFSASRSDEDASSVKPKSPAKGKRSLSTSLSDEDLTKKRPRVTAEGHKLLSTVVATGSSAEITGVHVTSGLDVFLAGFMFPGTSSTFYDTIPDGSFLSSSGIVAPSSNKRLSPIPRQGIRLSKNTKHFKNAITKQIAGAMQSSTNITNTTVEEILNEWIGKDSHNVFAAFVKGNRTLQYMEHLEFKISNSGELVVGDCPTGVYSVYAHKSDSDSQDPQCKYFFRREALKENIEIVIDKCAIQPFLTRSNLTTAAFEFVFLKGAPEAGADTYRFDLKHRVYKKKQVKDEIVDAGGHVLTKSLTQPGAYKMYDGEDFNAQTYKRKLIVNALYPPKYQDYETVRGHFPDAIPKEQETLSYLLNLKMLEGLKRAGRPFVAMVQDPDDVDISKQKLEIKINKEDLKTLFDVITTTPGFQTSEILLSESNATTKNLFYPKLLETFKSTNNDGTAVGSVEDTNILTRSKKQKLKPWSMSDCRFEYVAAMSASLDTATNTQCSDGGTSSASLPAATDGSDGGTSSASLPAATDGSDGGTSSALLPAASVGSAGGTSSASLPAATALPVVTSKVPLPTIRRKKAPSKVRVIFPPRVAELMGLYIFSTAEGRVVVCDNDYRYLLAGHIDSSGELACLN